MSYAQEWDPARDENPNLDNLTLSRKEGFRALAESPLRPKPDLLTLQQLAALGEAERAAYEKRRRVWHANLGPIKTPQLEAVHEVLWGIVDSNFQGGKKPRRVVAVDAFPGLGKTTAVMNFALEYHRREIQRRGAFTDLGHERWPVCRIGLTSNAGIKDFNKSILEFYAHPGRTSGTSALFVQRALDCILACETKILIIDDLHFLKLTNKDDQEVSDHFNRIVNQFPVTLIFIGVELEKHGLYSLIDESGDTTLSQTGRRATSLTMVPFDVDNDQHRRQWRQLLLDLEQQIVLSRMFAGMLTDGLSDYLYRRTTGHIGSLVTLINRGCQRAARTGTELLTKKLLEEVKIDAASKTASKALKAKFKHRRMNGDTTKDRAGDASASKNSAP
ncbi:AAA family ATPase [Streptomyces fulvoviolaceus]|uniref:AAA family ATPase n=1 Tax=Streptomyces fulvoviolaceus TaxID=285535 RepID=UPI0004C9E179|nr:TniB family NTP-binding protein [Streptomyces fulvoviolaceus]